MEHIVQSFKTTENHFSHMALKVLILAGHPGSASSGRLVKDQICSLYRTDNNRSTFCLIGLKGTLSSKALSWFQFLNSNAFQHAFQSLLF